MRKTRKIVRFIPSVTLIKALVLSSVTALILIALSLSVAIPVIAQTTATRAFGRIAFCCDGDICVINANGTNQIRLTNTTKDRSPAWSPDGNRIAFSSYRDGHSEIYVMNADGSNQTRLTHNSVDDLDPDWSPDGSKLVFERHDQTPSSGFGIYVMNSDGTGESRLSGIWTADRLPDWSPDGKQIAFVDHNSISLMNADGSNRRTLVRGSPVRGYYEPAWSPDGARILFSSFPINEYDEWGSPDQIHVYNLDGNPTKFNISQAGPVSTPAWSPDGTKITFVSYQENQSSIYTMKLDGSELMKVAQGWEPAWGAASSQCSGACWTSTGDLNTSRSNHTATLLPNGKVLVAGGNSDPGLQVVLRSSELYDPATGTWTQTGSLNIPRYQSTATLLPNGKVLIVGGISNPTTVTATAELYDPATGTWTLTGNLNETRFHHSATLLRNGKVLVAGGHGGQDGPRGSAELYDPASGTWSVTSRLRNTGGAGRMMHTATLLQNGKVLVAGGVDGDDFEVGFSSAELYHPDTGTWSVAGSLSTIRALQTATLLPNGKVLVVGGSAVLDSADLYDPATDTWSHAGTLRRWGNHTATLLPSGRVLIAGGANLSNGSGLISVDSADLYDVHTGVWSKTTSLDADRYSHTATPLQSGKVLIVGGVNSSVGTLDSADLYDPGTSSNTNPIDQPQFFVRQQYLDFLGREPDPTGLANWLATLGGCPNGGYGEFDNPHCDRVHVSAGFVHSHEFQGRGYWILRFGYVGLNRSIGSVRSSATYVEFTPALAQVGGSNSPAQEETAKVAYANAFVQRADFLALFPTTLTATQYLNALEANAAVTLPNKPALTAALNASTMSRAEVLRNVVESQVVFDKYLIPAFVTMEYFGYLRRDPDPIGYQNWVNTLSADLSNYRHMIFGFLYSTEYRQRFGAE